MAIKCSAETTITNQIDATDLIMWYYATTLTTKPLSPSTTSASATPTGWSLIEPTITSASDLSKYIYECLQIVWGDGTCSWGDVQLSASFEAAKQAYNLAHSTASIFTTFEQTHNKTLVDTVNESSSAITTLTESHQYGGINLLSNTKSIDSSSAPYTNSNISLYSNQAPIDGESFYYCSGPKYFQIDFPTLINNQKYTLSFDISRSSNSQPVFVKIDEIETNIGTAATTWTRLSHTFTASASTTNAQIRIAFDSTSSTATYIAAIRHIKLEQGSLATPWEYSSNDISTLSNTVNTVSQTADSNSSTISNLTQTLGTNANGTTKTDDIVHQVSDINQDLNGITTRVGKTEIALKGNYAVSSTAKGTANKQATISPTLANYELVQGAAITVKFTTENTAANPTLNINSTGAKPIKTYSGAALSESEYKWDAGSTMTFVYDGTNWCIQDSTELTRIKSNETLINQTANNVLIKATESDTTAAQGGQHLIQSLINVAPNGIKISADKVDIEGAAIFSENGYLSQDNINAINNESQTIYIQAVSGTSSISGTTTWVTNTGESVTQDAANLTPVWTIKRPIYRTNYPVLFVATQYKTIDGTVTCTTPLKDDTITVIDAGHITTGTIDASNITVTNLNADNITTGTINGQRIGVGSLSLDKLTEDVYTETEVNNIVDNLQTQIDGAIETWTGTNVPTLNNTPASAWTTDPIKDTHVGDVYFVVNDQSQQNGYNYRFTKTTSNGTSTYSWQLIKDNDVTNALQRLTTAEGKIGNIETFDSTVSSYMTNTDNEITSIKSAATTLSGRVDTAEGTLATKVDTSTFNTLSQTVEGNTQSISSLNTTITTKADSSTVSALQTQTNTISDTVDGHTQSITSLNNTVATKADGSEVTTLSNNLSSLQQDVNGFKTTVSETYSTKVETKMTNEVEDNIIWVDDAMAAPAIELIVRGKSEQITTTGKNLVSNVAEDWVLSSISGASRKALFIPVEEGSYTYHRRESYGAVGFIGTWYNNVTEESLGVGTWTNYPTRTVTNDGSWTHLVLSIAASIFSIDMIQTAEVQVEKGGAFTTYEPYTGGLPSPRPDWPQPILSVDGVELHASADGTTNATNWPVTLYDGTLRSLPDGTKDTLSLSYLRPSTREGWAWYQATLMALVGETTTAATDGVTGTVGVDVMSTTGEIADGPTVLYKLASAQTTTLDPIELPILHSSTCTIWVTADVTPRLYMKYWTLSAEGIVEPLLISDSDSEAQLSAISSRVSTAESNITQNADNIATKVSKDGVISSINQSAESIKIHASKVNIDGTAIFTNSDFQTQLNNQGYATTTQVNAVNNQEQLIYIQAINGTLSISDNEKPIVWVTNTGESVSSDTVGLTPVWTTKRPTYRSNYPILFVAIQRQTVGGTLTCTTPLKDDTTTIIDGGHIITGTIDASKLNAADINASNTLTIGALDSNTQSAILNSNISVGGRNLLQDSKFTAPFNAGWWTLDGLSATLSNNKLVIDGSIAATGNKRVYQSTTRFNHVEDITYTFSCDIVATAACQVSFGRRYGTTDSYGVTFNVTTTSQRISGTYTATGTGAFCISEVSNSATVTISNPKLEVGNVATDWTPAPEDIEAYADESAYLNAKPNIAPLGSVEFSNVYNATTNPNGYWRTTMGAWYTRLDDGWIHVYVDNSAGTNAVNNTSFRPSSSPTVVAGKVYTILTEIRNNASTGTGTNDFYLQQISNNQFWGNTIGVVIDDNHVTTTTTVSLLTCGQSYVLRSYRIADTDHLTAGTPSPEMFRYNFRAAKGSVLNFDFRMSVYEGIYDGPYKPYSGTQLFATQTDASEAAKTATNYITADSTGIKIHMSGNSTTYQHQSSTATTYYVNGNKRTEVSANGLEVFDGTYGSEESVAAFGTTARLGKATGNKVIADSTGVHIYDVQGSQVAAFGQALGELTTTMLSDEPEIGTNYPVPSDAISDISIMLDDQTLVEDTDYTLSSGIVTLLESATVTSILDDSGSGGEEGSEDVEAHSLICEYRASAGVGLAIGASVTRPGLDVAERAVFRHPSFVEASHSTANADTGFRAVRNDTGIQVFCGIGIGGVNHGVYSQTLKRWLINADRSAVHVAPHTVTDGNINVKSKYVYATTPSASKGNGWGHGLQFLDTAGDLVGVVKAYSLTTGEKGIQVQATRNISSNTHNNGIRFGVDTSGNLKLAFTGGGRLLWRQALGFDSGDVASSYGGSDNAPKNAYRDIPVTFNFTHTYVPHVVATFSTGSTGVTMGGLSLSVHDITNTGCTVRIYNNTNDTRNPALKWVAID